MKRNVFLSGLVVAAYFTTPLLLTGCPSAGELFTDSSLYQQTQGSYSSTHTANSAPTAHSTSAATGTSASAVARATTTSTSVAVEPLTSPVVAPTTAPAMAPPTVSQ